MEEQVAKIIEDKLVHVRTNKVYEASKEIAETFADHDGENELGWRVYTEEWGQVNGDWHCLAIRPAYLWYGK